MPPPPDAHDYLLACIWCQGAHTLGELLEHRTCQDPAPPTAWKATEPMHYALIATLAALACFAASLIIGATIKATNPSDEAGELDRRHQAGTCPEPTAYYAARAARRTYR